MTRRVGFTHRALVLVSMATLSTVAVIANTFTADDPRSTLADRQDATAVKPRVVSHLRDSWEAERAVGDGSRCRALDVNTIDEVPSPHWCQKSPRARPA